MLSKLKTPEKEYLKADTGASNTFLKKDHTKFLTNIKHTPHGPQVHLPNNTILQPSHKGNLSLNDSQTGMNINAYVLPGMTNESLLSIGQLCDNGYKAIFTKDNLKIKQGHNTIITGNRNLHDGLWDIPFPNQNTSKVNYVVTKDKTKYELAKYLHACAFSPSLHTFQQAISNGNFITWPGIEEINFKKFLGNTPQTAKGRLDQEKQGLQSTKDLQQDFFPPHEPTKTFHIAAKIEPFSPKHTAYTDLTGRFPHKSSRGHQYLLVLYDYDSNAILAAPLKSRQAQEITKTWNNLHTKLTRHGHITKHYILDNECSADLKLAMVKANLSFELAPPNIHRRNAAERAIRTFKNHFLSGLATCPQDFPITEWDRLLEQALLTLNLLRNSRVNPRLSAHAYLFGNHNFNKVPLVPPGTKLVVHNKPGKRPSWAFHGDDGWSIGPAPQHYRCIKCYIPKTHSTRISDTISIIPTVIPIPEYNLEEKLFDKITDLVNLLEGKFTSQLPKNKNLRDALHKIADILNRTYKPPIICTPPKPSKPAISEGENTQNIVPISEGEISRQKQTPITTASRPKPISSKKNTQPLARILQREANNQPSESTKLQAQHIYTGSNKETIDTLIAGPTKEIWQQALANEIGRLAQGIGDIKGTNTLCFIPKNEIPNNKKITYANIVCDYRPLNTEKHRVRLTVGGDKLDYENDASSPAATLLDTKLILNSTISDACRGARFATIDIKDFFLQSTLPSAEYMRIHSKYFTEDIKSKYNINNLQYDDGYVYCKIQKGMYGLKQAARLAYEQLVKNLGKHGYAPSTQAPNIWHHNTNRTKFCLCIDDFGIKYFCPKELHHLIDTLKKYYAITVDLSGTDYCGLTIQWDYNKGFVDISMPSYTQKALKKLRHDPPTKPQHAPHKWTIPNYGATPQLTPVDNSPKLTPQGQKRIQSVTGTFLYYGRAVDASILPAINDIASMQAHPTEQTNEKVKMLLDYLCTYPNAKVRYYASNMILHIDSDAAYLVLPGA